MVMVKRRPSKASKKLVDLIYLDQKKQVVDLEKDYRARISSWLDWINNKLDSVVDDDVYPEEQSEYFLVNNFLKNLLAKRLDWIIKSAPNDDLKVKYLLALPPFNQRGKIKNFLLHFFQFKDSKDNNRLQFEFVDNSEKEVRVLMDIYKISKTLETIEVIRASIASVNPFPSVFESMYSIELLNTFSSVLNLLISKCVKQPYLEEMLYQFPMDCLEPEKILYRKEKQNFYIQDAVLERLDYRNFIFHIYFRSSLKVNNLGRDHVFTFNYLDYEIIRQEFLIHWLYSRLNNNPRKEAILDNYYMGNRTFSDIIQSSPGSELYLLKQLSKEDFEKLITEVNDTLDQDSGLPFDLMSETFGDFARKLFKFETAKKLARKSIAGLKKYILRKNNENRVSRKLIEDPSQKPDRKPNEKKGKSGLKIEILTKSDIDFPFFCTINSNFSRRQALIKARMQTVEYECFKEDVKKIIIAAGDEMLIKRRTPRHEWVVAYLIEEMEKQKVVHHLLILGVEAKNQHMSMGYGSGFKEDFNYVPYLVYGSLEKQAVFGAPEETRIARGERYYVYPLSNSHTIEKAKALTDYLVSTLPPLPADDTTPQEKSDPN